LRLLLDTHVAVWAVTGAHRLAHTTLALISEADAVAVSIASLWEVAVKNNLGRRVTDPLGISVANARAEFDAASFDVLSISLAHLTQVEVLPLIHRDPFDRMIVAVALADTYRLVTHDRTLREYGGDVLLV